MRALTVADEPSPRCLVRPGLTKRRLKAKLPFVVVCACATTVPRDQIDAYACSRRANVPSIQPVAPKVATSGGESDSASPEFATAPAAAAASELSPRWRRRERRVKRKGGRIRAQNSRPTGVVQGMEIRS